MVQLRPGFKVEKGATFHARIDNCITADLRNNETNSKYVNEILAKAYETLYLEHLRLNDSLQQEYKSLLNVYPNPFNNSINIEVIPEFYNQNLSIEINDLTGKTIHTQNLNKLNTSVINLNLNEIAKGTYFIKINCNNKVYNQKIIKK